MSFVVGIVGLICYILYFIYDSAKAEAYNKINKKTIETNHIIMANWYRSVVDKEYERNFSFMDKDIRNDVLEVLNTFEHFKPVKEEFDRLPYFEGGILNYLCFRKSVGTYTGKHIMQIIYMGLQGKLLYEDAWMGIDSPGPTNEDLWWLHLDLMKWLEEQLKSHGVNEVMMFKPGHSREIWTEERAATETRMTDINEKFKIQAGVFYWYPMRNFHPLDYAEYLNS